MRKIICRAALMLALCLPVCALAATEPNAKTIEDTTTYEGDTIRITIDQWCYAFNRTNLRFFVANVYVSDPAQMQTAFAGEQYSKNNAEATSAIAERHDAILAINGDYYNYKDKNGLVIRNGVLYRDAASSRDQLLVMRDGTFIALPRGTYAAGEGQKYIDEGVVQSFTFGPLLVNDGEAVELPEKYIISTKDTIREPRTAIGQVDANHYVLVVADGRRDGILPDLLAEGSRTLCTRFLPSPHPISGVKKWIAHSEGFAKGEVHVTREALDALGGPRAVSLLPVGVSRVEGVFEKDDIVRIVAPDGRPVGAGKVSCDSTTARRNIGRRGARALIHYDYLYLD